ncbi:MAG: THUMP domain-containing protein [Nitrososphaerota archaeon]|nr:THUMP domain-containing protein [Candidatus Bathyarchaeota archaeon]MDW8048998.1 THUMP domain-containing protein [Nitrososphaerota archaeon]
MALDEFNLLVSTPRGLESDACSEIWFLLRELGDEDPLVERSEVAGLVVAKTALDSFKVIENLRKRLRDRPQDFRYTLRFIPIEIVVRTDLDQIRRACSRLVEKIGPTETFRVTVEKRHTDLQSGEIIRAAAEVIDRKVDLENPQKILLIEILGRLTGVSVIVPEDILSVSKERVSSQSR